MAQAKEFFTRIMQKHDTEANWALKTDFTPLAGEIIVYDKDNNYNYRRIKIGDGGTKINNLPFTVTDASATVPGITIVYPASSCSTFTSDKGSLTPAAAKKAVDTFAITKIAGGTLTNGSNAQKDEPSIGWKTIGANTPYIGFAKDQADGTFVWSLTGTNYQDGLAIGGGSGKLFWKGKRIATTDNSLAVGSSTKPIYMSADGVATACTYKLEADVPAGAKFTDTTYSNATTSAAGLMSAADKTKLNNTNVAYGTCSTAAATAAKVVTLSGNDNWTLTIGAIIMVKFSSSNSAENVTLNVNNTGAYPIWYNNEEYVSTGTAYTGYAGRTITYSFNGTHWVWISGSYDANTQSNTNSTDTSSKIFLVGATSQGSSKTTYSHGEVYVGTDHHVYSNSKQVVNLSDTQALTNKTYNGYTLGAACEKGVDTTATSGSTNLITSGAMYTALSGKLSTSGTAAKATADASGNTITSYYMPKSGGTFTGNAVAYSTNRNTDGGCLRNIEVRTSSNTGTLQSTNKIIMVRG